MHESFAVRTHQEMQDVLMNPNASGPDIHYYMIRGGNSKKNITVWESGTVANEYIKSYGHYHVDDLPETYEIVHGEGVILMQIRKTEDGQSVDDEIESVQAVFVKKGDVVHIPPRAGHLMANTGRTWLITVDDSPIESNKKDVAWPVHADYAPIKGLHGFSYYILEKDGKPVFVKNSRYKAVPEIHIVS